MADRVANRVGFAFDAGWCACHPQAKYGHRRDNDQNRQTPRETLRRLIKELGRICCSWVVHQFLFLPQIPLDNFSMSVLQLTN
jgi:hypothetical protein